VFAEPRPDASAAADLAAALARVGYTEEAIHDELGDDAYSSGPGEIPVHERRLDDSPFALAVRLLFLDRPLPAAEVERALGRRAVEALARTGLAEVGDSVIPLARVLPIDDLLVAADSYSRGAHDPPGYVASYTPTSRLLDNLTPRRRVRGALDVGTGSGVQALRAASHARRVVATDVNDRALAYAALNAALNGFTNVEFTKGSGFEPVGDEQFDLITCNAPYVVSPEQRWAYRDTGARGDEFSERVVADAAQHLAEGGHAAMLVSWVASDPDEPDARVLEWVGRTGCDGWLLVAWEHDPLDHAAGWNSHLDEDADAYARALDEWTRHFDELDVRWISEGAVLLHRREGPTSVRVDEIDGDEVDDASTQVLRAFEARERLADLPRREALLRERLVPAVPLRVERELGRARGRVCVDGGTNTRMWASAAALAVVEALDGRKLGAAVSRVARHERVPAPRLEREAVRLARELLELGALRFARS
jgi:methylase of polypeptide subunit release factors